MSSKNVSTRVSRTSIHTPLQPASVQDLKAKFDPSTGDPAVTTLSSAKIKTLPNSEKKLSTQSKESPFVSSCTSSSKISSSVTISSVSSSLQAAAQRKLGAPASATSTTSATSSTASSITSTTSATSSTASSITSTTSATSSTASSITSSKSAAASVTSAKSASSSSLSSIPSVNTRTASLALTTARPFSPSKTQASSGKSSPVLENSKTSATCPPSIAAPKWELKSKNPWSASSSSLNSITNDTKSIFERDKCGRLELPVMHITSTGNDVTVDIAKKSPHDSKLRNGRETDAPPTDSSHTAQKNNSPPTLAKSKFHSDKPNAVEGSPPVQRSKRLVAREIQIERLDSGENITSYKDKPLNSTTAKTEGPKLNIEPKSSSKSDMIVQGNILSEIKVERIPSHSAKTEAKPEFAQVKLRNVKSTLDQKPAVTAKSPELNDKRISRKISSERFERLMMDFQRGVPTETIPRKDSETDHIILQQKARELTKSDVVDDIPIIAKKKKEESIFTEGLKVSDFVKQVNKMNPDLEGPPKWKIQKARSQTSSTASSDVGGDNFYQGIPGEEDIHNASEEDDDIYEVVAHRVGSGESGQSGSTRKAPGRRLGVYSQMKNFKNFALLKLKQRGSKKKVETSKADPQSDSEEKVVYSDGEGSWIHSDRSSTGTEYEDVEQDGPDEECFYEDLETFKKPSNADVKNKPLSKLKNIFSNSKSKAKKVSADTAATDSEGDLIDEMDETDNDQVDTLSRTSSERSSGRLTREDTTLSSISTNNSGVNIDESSSTQTTSMPPPPPLPPRTSKVLSQPAENSPPLPPRNPALSNKATLGIPLDTVVPVSPPGRNSNSYGNKKRFSYGSDGLESSTGKLDYIDQDPASPNTLEKLERSERKSINSSRPASSSCPSYMYPDISAFPELKGGSSDENLYVDLEDEHIYGKSSDVYVSQFESEPLYQWYNKNKMIQNIGSDQSTADELSDEDYLEVDERKTHPVYEDVERLLEKTSSSSSISASSSTKSDRQQSLSAKDKPQRRSVIEDVFKKGGTLHRALWCQMPEVIESGLLLQLSDQEKKIQEAMFEIMTSEASYLKSLKVLITVFLSAPEFSAEMSDRCVITKRERQILFSNIGHIKDISEEFLKDLETRWQESCYMSDVCDIIYKHASKNFEPYVRYCSNQAFQDRALNTLKLKPEFNEAVKRLELHPDCQFLPLASFLLLPMQRITRMPLLVDAVCHRLETGTPRHSSAKKALDSLTKVAKRCDEAAKKMQQTEQICLLASNLEFKVKEFPLVSSSRFLVKQGEMTLIKSDATTRKPLSKLLGSHKEHIYLFLFNDLLLVTKKKGVIFQVRDYCQRNSLHVEAIDNLDKSRHIAPGSAAGLHNILFLAMLANHENKQVELILSCKSESERARWIDAIAPAQMSADNERIYDYWDCPQFQCVRKYIAQQPDELTLEEADVINVTRKIADGWCEGERIRDGERGWFPASHTEEINNSHVRARNLRLRYRLMIASQEFAQNDFKH
ncbi:serine-rich adhesin for platelets-like isoform X2 [Physella acuta]|uniref:serine-rich adhesin for platelets-like isoform X2 n=1 Tax=Physella acuta TaxID=109671 RepID=UPI0027DCA904|nr:serine-rich adhesin for platelets-like isoform X2 [Physella acuta]